VNDLASQLYANRGLNNFNAGELAFNTAAGGCAGGVLAHFRLGGPSQSGRTSFQGNSIFGSSSRLVGSNPKGLLNNNDFVRVGWGFRTGGLQNFRIGIGSPKWKAETPIGTFNFHFHIDFWNP
jgi:hypothetical protein